MSSQHRAFDAEGFQGTIEEIFSEIVEQYSGMAYSVAYRMLNNAHDAEDAVQEAFISAYRALPSFKRQSKYSTWLYRIVVNACLMKIRKEESRSRYLTNAGYEDMEVADWSQDPEDAAVNTELRQVLQEGLSRLPPILRAAVVIRDVQGFSSEEAAEVLKLPVAALKSRLHRGRVLLRKYMEGYVANPAPRSA